MFFEGGLKPLVSSVLTHQNPLYVQFYVTARCNLRCQQCNIIYGFGDQEECSIEQIQMIATNLAAIGTSVVLLTGGEPFARADLPEIAQAFIAKGIHPRIQTNGFASNEALQRAVDYGVHDISISLDSLNPHQQDEINGGFEDSWQSALSKVAFINSNFPSDSFCAFGCVLSPHNIDQIIPVVKFATEIGWWMSIVPAHQSPVTEPRSFATYDEKLVFRPDQYSRIATLVSELKQMKRSGFNLYDSDEYLDDVVRYITRSPIHWRRRNSNSCDSPNLYFAIQPNGDMGICCDYRLGTRYSVYHKEFPKWYQEHRMFDEARATTSTCSGCMYGSYPEISISARYLRPMLQRGALFLRKSSGKKLNPISYEELIDLARHFSSGTA